MNAKVKDAGLSLLGNKAPLKVWGEEKTKPELGFKRIDLIMVHQGLQKVMGT